MRTVSPPPSLMVMTVWETCDIRRGTLTEGIVDGSWVGCSLVLQKAGDKSWRRAFNRERPRVYSWPGGEPLILDAQPTMSTATGCFRLTALSIALVVGASGCTNDKNSLAQGPAPQSATAGPRFAPSGPDADEFGAGQGYPVGDRNTFFSVPFLVGSQSHHDEIFPIRSVRRAATASS